MVIVKDILKKIKHNAESDDMTSLKENYMEIKGAIEELESAHLKLTRDKKFFSQIQKLASIGFWELDMEKDYNYWSEETYRIFGKTPKDFKNNHKDFLHLVHEEDRKIVREMTVNPPKEPSKIEFRIIKDGEVRQVSQITEAQYGAHGELKKIYGTIKDVTEKKSLEKSLSLKKREIADIRRKYEVIIKESEDIVAIVDADGKIDYINEAFKKIVGYDAKEVIGKCLLDYFDKDDKANLSRILEKVSLGKNTRLNCDLEITTKYGKLRYLEASVRNMTDEKAINGIVINLKDMTQRVKFEKKIRHIAYRDDSTGLPNKRALKSKARELSCFKDLERKRFALMMIDIIETKEISDNLGSKVEKKLILKIVERMSNLLKKEDVVFRYSEQRIVILTRGLLSYYHSLSKEILESFEKPFRVDRYDFLISTNIGVSIYPRDSNADHSIIESAKIAMLQSKQRGRNKISFYSSDVDVAHLRKFMLRHDAKKAIEKNQLKIYYQPMVNVRSFNLLAAEISVVWDHPEWGIIMPEEFFRLIESSKTMSEIERWVVDEVCKQYRLWLDLGYPPIKISANISSPQFYESSFVSNIVEKVKHHGLNPDFLIMEISEEVLSKNTESALEVIKNLKESGVSIAIDKLGVGFSTFKLLNFLEVDVLKIDRALLRDSLKDEKNKIILNSFVKLVKELDVKLVVDGVDSWDEIKAWRDLDCYTAQGPIFSPRVSESEFTSIVSKGRCKPNLPNYGAVSVKEERRKYYRIEFSQLLEAEMTILKIKNKSISVGKNKVLIKNIGPGGLCFISDIKFPSARDIVLQFSTKLIETDIKAYGVIAWADAYEEELYRYGIEFTFDENDRDKIISVLNKVQLKMKKDMLFADGSFVNKREKSYFRDIKM